MFHRILVPLDGSPRAFRVLPYAVVLATELQAELLLLTVSGDDRHPTPLTTADLEKLEAALKPTGPCETGLQSAVQRLVARVPAVEDRPENSVPYTVTHHSASGRLPQAILDVASEKNADLILIAESNCSGFDQLRHARVSAGLLHQTTVPLLMVPANSAALQAPSLAAAFSCVSPALLRRPMLVPLDGGGFAEKALDLAKSLAARVCGSLLLCEALPAPQQYLQYCGLLGAHIYLDFLDQEQPDQTATAYLCGCAQRDGLPIRAVETKVVLGRPADAILGCAGRCNPGLIVMASHARSGMGRMLLGSVTEQVLRRGQHPVLVVGPAYAAKSGPVASGISKLAAIEVGATNTAQREAR